jgi:osmotically-inducible protein OsmY
MTALLGQARIRDLQIEGAVQLALEQHAQVPFERIKVSVSDAVATLSGLVDWRYQRVAALAATRTVAGVRDVNDQLRVTFD